MVLNMSWLIPAIGLRYGASVASAISRNILTTIVPWLRRWSVVLERLLRVACDMSIARWPYERIPVYIWRVI